MQLNRIVTFANRFDEYGEYGESLQPYCLVVVAVHLVCSMSSKHNDIIPHTGWV